MSPQINRSLQPPHLRVKRLLYPLLMLALAFSLAVSVQPAAASATDSILRAKLTGEAEVPGPGDPDGRGLAWIGLFPDAGRVCWRIVAADITLPATAAHIHDGAADVAGPVVVTLGGPGENGISQGCTTADAALINDIRAHPEEYYVNVHTTDYPSGAIRGQLH